MRQISVIVAVALQLLALFIQAKAARPAKPHYRILFIGNSLTSKNQLPLQFKWLTQAARKNVFVASSTIPSATFEVHSQSPQTMGMLAKGNWTHVILQEQSFFLSLGVEWESQRSWPAARILANAARPAKVILYETMGYYSGFSNGDTYEAMQQRVIDGYERVRQLLDCETAHVGMTWRRARHSLASQNKSEWMLYFDEVHPSSRGTFLVACAMYMQIFQDASLARIRPRRRRGVPLRFSAQAKRWALQEYQFENQ